MVFRLSTRVRFSKAVRFGEVAHPQAGAGPAEGFHSGRQFALDTAPYRQRRLRSCFQRATLRNTLVPKRVTDYGMGRGVNMVTLTRARLCTSTQVSAHDCKGGATATSDSRAAFGSTMALQGRLEHTEQLDQFRRNYLSGYLFISPWLIGFIVFTLGPFIMSLYLSFTDYTIVTRPVWVGLDNYVKLFTDDPTSPRPYSTLYYVIFHVPDMQIINSFWRSFSPRTSGNFDLPHAVLLAHGDDRHVRILWQWIFTSSA